VIATRNDSQLTISPVDYKFSLLTLRLSCWDALLDRYVDQQ
jgi:hypothetical protein